MTAFNLISHSWDGRFFLVSEEERNKTQWSRVERVCYPGPSLQSVSDHASLAGCAAGYGAGFRTTETRLHEALCYCQEIKQNASSWAPTKLSINAATSSNFSSIILHPARSQPTRFVTSLAFIPYLLIRMLHGTYFAHVLFRAYNYNDKAAPCGKFRSHFSNSCWLPGITAFPALAQDGTFQLQPTLTSSLICRTSSTVHRDMSSIPCCRLHSSLQWAALVGRSQVCIPRRWR